MAAFGSSCSTDPHRPAWARRMAGAGTLHLVPERMALVLRHVDTFRPTELELVATVEDGAFV